MFHRYGTSLEFARFPHSGKALTGRGAQGTINLGQREWTDDSGTDQLHGTRVGIWT
jgi:hypothetical protein